MDVDYDLCTMIDNAVEVVKHMSSSKNHLNEGKTRLGFEVKRYLMTTYFVFPQRTDTVTETTSPSELSQ